MKKEASLRLVLVIGGAVMALSASLSRRGGHPATAAFLCPLPGLQRVKVSGNILKPGVYDVAGAIDAATVIKMTGGHGDHRNGGDRLKLISGDEVVVGDGDGKTQVIAVGRMKVHQAIAAGIPLDVNRLSQSELNEIPGIGPALADAIVDDRQKNGDYPAVEAIERVPGVGKLKLEKLKKFITCCTSY